MDRTTAAAVAAVTLGFLAIATMVLAALALTDIARGEPDLTLEWAVVKLAVVVVIVSQGLSLLAIGSLLASRRRRERSAAERFADGAGASRATEQ